MLIIFSPALAFFGGRTFLKYKELQLKHGALSHESARRFVVVERENEELRRRIETLETIATGMTPSSSTSVASQLLNDRTGAIDGALRLKLLEQQVRDEARALAVRR